MQVQNISGIAQYFSFGPGVRGQLLAVNGVANLPDDLPAVQAKVSRYVERGLLKITDAPTGSETEASKDLPAFAYLQVNGAVADNDTVTVNGIVFEFENDPGSGVLGEYVSTLTLTTSKWAGDGAAAATAVATLRTALNAHTATTGLIADAPVQYSSGKYLLPLRRSDGLTAATGFTLAVSGTNLSKSGGGLSNGALAASYRKAAKVITVVAGDVTNGAILLATGLVTVARHLVSVRTAAGAAKAWGGLVLVSGGNIVLANNGTVDFADTDVITVVAEGQ